MFWRKGAGDVARVPNDELERSKAEVSLVRLVEGKGVELREHGPDLIGCCPFHDDRDPSFVVSVSKNLWCCHGACQVGGSVIDFVMRSEGVSFRHAVDLLRQGVGVTDGAPVKESTVVKMPLLVRHRSGRRGRRGGLPYQQLRTRHQGVDGRRECEADRGRRDR